MGYFIELDNAVIIIYVSKIIYYLNPWIMESKGDVAWTRSDCRRAIIKAVQNNENYVLGNRLNEVNDVGDIFVRAVSY